MFLNGGLLFDPDRFDLSSIPGIAFEEAVDFAGHDGKVNTFIITDPEG